MSTAPIPKPKTMSEYVVGLKKLQDNYLYGDLRGKIVADLSTGDANLCKEILQAGAERCYVVGNSQTPDDPRVVCVPGKPWNAQLSDVDVAFFDARALPDFDPVNGVGELMLHLKRILKPQGILFAVLKTGIVNHGFDVSNSIAQSPANPLPSQDYLFADILRNYAIRTLERIPTENTFEVIRFFRIAPKKPSLLLILGRSQSGKTSLAREFASLSRHVHISNDYIFWELATFKKKAPSHSIPPIIIEKIGDGSASACGQFNRELDRDPDLLNQYLRLIEPLIPRTKNLISMDWDLLNEEHISIAKEFFTNAGFSVWIMRRETENAEARLAQERKVSADFKRKMDQAEVALAAERKALQNLKTQNEQTEMILAEERKAAVDFKKRAQQADEMLKRAEQAEATLAKESSRFQRITGHWWTKLGKSSRLLPFDD